ncbi:MAG: hypothetical protein C0423_21645 [Methylibium sp.]|nr:hypothetical protein [Methylibium sp.]
MAFDSRPLRRFQYRARDAAGAERVGVVEAADEPSALRELIKQGLQPLRVDALDRGAAGAPRKLGRGASITAADRIIVMRELATLLQAGVSVAEALPSVAEAYQETPLGDVLARVTQRVSGGAGLSESLRESRLQLPAYALALVQAGEASGEMAGAISEAADQMEHDRRVADEMRNALVYPTILVVVGLIVITAIFVGVVPRFGNMLQSGRADIPEFSRQVIGAGVFVKKHFGEFAFGLAGMLIIVLGLFSGDSGQRRFMRVVTKVPALHRWLLEADLGRWAMVLSALLGNRVGVIQALNLSASAVRLEHVATDVRRLARELERGRTMADALGDLGWFPRNRLNLVRVGERSGQLPKTLATLGSIHSDAARSRQRRMLTLIEPLAILVIGAAIGFVMVAVMSAITSVNSVV